MRRSVGRRDVRMKMQSRYGRGALFDSQLSPHLAAKTFLFTIICGGFVLEQAACTQHHGDPDRVIFPGPISSRSRALDNDSVGGSADGSDTPIPLDLAKRLNSIELTEQFLQLLDGVPESGEHVALTSRFGGEERSNAMLAKPAGCIPELQVVPILNNDSAELVFPTCTRIKRCGGCCASPLLSCQPAATEMRNFEVIVWSMRDSGTMTYRERRIVPLEEATKCKCDCVIKEEHCNDKQRYVPDECKCACNNNDEEEKCRKNNAKEWNWRQCVCSCRDRMPCSTGLYFDDNTCRCTPIMLSRPLNRFATMNYNYTSRPENRRPVIIPLDPSDPRRRHKEDPEYK